MQNSPSRQNYIQMLRSRPNKDRRIDKKGKILMEHDVLLNLPHNWIDVQLNQ